MTRREVSLTVASSFVHTGLTVTHKTERKRFKEIWGKKRRISVKCESK